MGKDSKQKIPRLGKQLPRFRFFLNPYKWARFSTCPQCSSRTSQKKLPLFIHIKPAQPLLLNKTCRYCAHCDLLIAHQNELDDIIGSTFPLSDEEKVSSQYLVIGTVDRTDYRRINKMELQVQATIEALHDFKEVVIFEYR